MVSLSPKTYFAVDRGSKLVGLLLLTAALGGAAGDYAGPVALVGIVVGLATVFVDPEDD